MYGSRRSRNRELASIPHVITHTAFIRHGQCIHIFKRIPILCKTCKTEIGFASTCSIEGVFCVDHIFSLHAL